MIPFPNIDPVAIALGPVEIRWYALAYLAGFIGGWIYALRFIARDKDIAPTREQIEDFMPWIVLGVILGGRLGYVLFYNFEYYLYHPLETLMLWQGGMSFHGGVLGVLSAILLYGWRQGISPFRLGDVICVCAPIGLFFGRIANFINAELYGRIANPDSVPWAVIFPNGGNVPRHPSQLYEALLEGVVLFLILYALSHSKKIRHSYGFLSGAFLCGYGCFRAFIEVFREPDAHIGFLFEYVTMGQLLSLPMVLIGIALMIYARKNHAKTKKV